MSSPYELYERIRSSADKKDFCKRLEYSDYTGRSVHGSCADHIELSWIVNNEGFISAIYLGGDGCMLSRAGGVLLAQSMMGAQHEEAARISLKDLCQKMGVAPESISGSRATCLGLGIAALQSALSVDK